MLFPFYKSADQAGGLSHRQRRPLPDLIHVEHLAAEQRFTPVVPIRGAIRSKVMKNFYPVFLQ